MRFVLDASVALSWCLPDESNRYADGVLAKIGDWTPVVPALWSLEVTNALLVAQRRGRINSDQLGEMTTWLSAIPIELESMAMKRTIRDVMPIARAEEIPVYDACYVELAQRHGIPLATVDGALTNVAKRRGIGLI